MTDYYANAIRGNPGISYRDYIIDSSLTYTIPDGGCKVTAQYSNGAGWSTVSQSLLQNIKTNRLREVTTLTPPEDSGSGPITVKARINVDFDTSDTRPNFSIGMVGLLGFNFTTTHHQPLRINIIIESGDIGDLDTHTFVYIIPNQKGDWARNKRFSINNYLIPTLWDNKPIKKVRKVTIEFDVGNIVLSVGRLWVGNFMPVCFDSDWSITLDNPSKINYSSGLDAHVVEQRRRRRGSFPISDIKDEDVHPSEQGMFSSTGFVNFSDMQLQTGKDYPLIVAHRYPFEGSLTDNPDGAPDAITPNIYALFGLMSKDMSIQHVNGPLYQTQIDVVELI